jgi:formylglycine-generating enzyme required for sulfatase activity
MEGSQSKSRSIEQAHGGTNMIDLKHYSQGKATIGSNIIVNSLHTWSVRLPTESQWQRAAVGDTGGPYPWGNGLDPSRANYGNNIGKPTPVGSYPSGASPFGVMDMVGNLSEWCLNQWNTASEDLSGYGKRTIGGMAWNVSNEHHLRAIDRGGWPPRGRLNDFGFRPVLILNQTHQNHGSIE